jgi:hypothetical protein
MADNEHGVSYVGEVHRLENIAAILGDEQQIAQMRAGIEGGDVYIVKGVMDRKQLEPIREYLATIGGSSLPNYGPIVAGAPNSHRINDWDERAFVQGCFHQFQFFPWNQDMFGLFERFTPIYRLKNRLSGLPVDSFLGTEPEDGITARLSFQFYPRGVGGLNMHADPVDRHQLTVPTMLLSRKGEDYQTGGLVVETAGGERIDVDAMMDWGDVLFFRADLAHGVDRVDPDAEPNWLSFEGRWMVVIAVNKVAGIADVVDAVDLGS